MSSDTSEKIAESGLKSIGQSTSVRQNSYGQILKSSALIGGSQVVNIAVGIVRTKAMALLLGPAGFGIAGLYSSIVDLTQNVVGMGVNSSGVRQIAEAVGSENPERVMLVIAVLRRTSIVLGSIGALALVLFRRPISAVTFGSDNYAIAVAWLSLAAFFKLVSGGQGALIQGMRRVRELALMTISGAVLGAISGVVLVYLFRENGIVLYVIAVAGLSCAMSWWYSRKVRIMPVQVSLYQVHQEATNLLKLGFAFMASGLMTIGSAYLVRVMLLHKIGLEATGLYQSSWTLGGLYVGFILQAMGADFYPRLTASASDNVKCNRLVNEQTRISLLLAAPGVIATLTFAPIVIALFYSSKFGAAVGILRWICLGTAMQVITWPMGFIIIAKGEQAIFFWCEVAWGAVSVALAWFCIEYFGATGAGVAFFGSYVFHLLLIYPVTRRLSGFRWSAENRQTVMILLSLIAAAFSGFYVLPFYAAIALGTIAAVASAAYSARSLMALIHTEDIPHRLRRLIATLGILDTHARVAE